MLRKHIFIGFFLAMSFNAFPNFNIEEFFSLDREMRGVKKITEQQRNNAKVVSFFDKEGFLLRKTHYLRNKMKADYRYEYSISDTLLEVKYHYRKTQNINPEEGYIIDRYYYNSLKQCYRIETYLSKDLENPAGASTNFIYQEGLLQSYEARSYSRNKGDFYKYDYVYDDNQRTELFHIYEDSILVDNDSSKSISIYKNGKLTDFIRVAPDGQLIVSGEPNWNSETGKVHIQYSNFDKRGNWTRSCFITEKGKTFRSERKIEYW